ncbi:MAG: phage scaffolding protein, partial [Christensenellaceae bacterium]
MKTEFLKELGLEKDVIDKIFAENGKDVEAFKTKAGTLETERDGLKTQLEEANKAIEEFKGLDVEGIKKATEEWKQKAEQAEKDSAAKIVIQKFC